MFTPNQKAILFILAKEPHKAFTMSEIGRRLGKAPGVFQRGLNSLERNGYISSRREANLRLLSFNTSHPLAAEFRTITRRCSDPLPSDVYLGYPPPTARGARTVAEPPGTYTASRQKLIIIAGPNGAGKTTFAREFLPGEAGCPIFINADYIAHGLSPFSPDSAAMRAGKLMIHELNDHIQHRRNVAVETTLSGSRYARLIPLWQKDGYAVKLIFLALPTVELAVARVASRVKQGGHAIPEQTIRRRFRAGRRNFDPIYKPRVDAWALYDNAGNQPVLVEEDEQ